MKYALTHLSGNLRGKTQYFDRPRLSVGIAPDNDLVIRSNGGGSHIPASVEFIQRDCDIHVRNTDPKVTILVNQNPLHEAILQDKDLLQLGPDGPKLRFRIRSEDFAACKNGKEILRDTLDLVAEDKKSGRGAVRPFVGQLTYEVSHYASKKTQAIVLVSVLILFGGVFLGGYYLFSTLQQEHKRDLETLSEKLESARMTQALLEQRIAEERQRLRDALTARQTEINRLVAQLKNQPAQGLGTSGEEVRVLKERLEVIEAQRTKTDIFIRQYGPSVCFLYIAYGFFFEGKPTEVPSIPLEFMGTGFLINPEGQIVTNRHIVEPWTMEPSTSKIIKSGIRPRLLTLLAYFPGVPEPFKVQVVKVSTKADVAVAQLTPIPPDIPPIPIHHPTYPAKAGIPVMILGYPVGVEALLARMDQGVVESLLRESGRSLQGLVQKVANRRGIRPLANQGHIGDVVPGRIVYDAPTTGGASGSPVFNSHGEVIAVNAAIMTRFGGANSGIPIELLLELLPATKRQS